MREILGGELSEAAIDRALAELSLKLRITRVDYRAEQGAYWDVLLRWCPDEVREGMNMSIAEALTALVSKYIECVVAAEQLEVEEFFSTFIGRGPGARGDQRAAGRARVSVHPRGHALDAAHTAAQADDGRVRGGWCAPDSPSHGGHAAAAHRARWRRCWMRPAVVFLPRLKQPGKPIRRIPKKNERSSKNRQYE